MGDPHADYAEAVNAWNAQYKEDDARKAQEDREAQARKYVESLPPPAFFNDFNKGLTSQDMLQTYENEAANPTPGLKLGAPSPKLIEAAAKEKQAEEAAAAALAAKTAAVDPAGVTPATNASDMPGAPLQGAAPPPARQLGGPLTAPDGSNLSAQHMVRFGMSGIDPAATDVGMQLFQQSQAGIAHEQAALRDALSDDNVAAGNREAAARVKLASDTAKNAELAPVLEERARIAKENEIQTKQLVNTATQETTAQMARVRQAADEAGNASINSFWADKSTAGKVIGIISQALAGAANGLSGQPGAPTPLDRIISADLEKQKANLNNKVTKSYNEQGILGQMHKQFESSLAANGAAYLASLNHTDALAKEISQKYATPEAQAAYQEFHAANLEKAAQAARQVHQTLLSSNLQQSTTGAQIIERTQSANATYQAALLKANSTKGQNHIFGLKGPVTNEQYHALQEHAQAVAVSLDSYEGIKDLMKPGQKTDLAWVRKFNNLASNAYAARRVDAKTGARLEGKEAELVELGVPKISEALAGKLTHEQLYSYANQIDSMIKPAVSGFAARAKAVTGADYDYADPQIGRYLTQIARPAQ